MRQLRRDSQRGSTLSRLRFSADPGYNLLVVAQESFALPWPLVALGLVTLVLASMALYKTLRPSEISLAQMAAHAGDVECTDSQGRVLSISSDGTWSGLEMQGTWTASGDTLEISGEDATRTLALKISGISGVSLELDRLPITWTFDGQTGEFGLDALGDQDQPVGCRRV